MLFQSKARARDVSVDLRLLDADHGFYDRYALNPDLTMFRGVTGRVLAFFETCR